jgi:subtilisin-like proprotein convertase family protein
MSSCGGGLEALRVAEAARALPGVELAEPLLAVLQQKRAMPNDPLLPQQWHLKFSGQAGAVAGTDINAELAWSYDNLPAGVRGNGIVIGIVDDGLQIGHPDFKVDASLGYDWNQGDTDPNPFYAEDNHGTACGGDAAAIGNNLRGGSGSAPEATLAGLRLIGDASTDEQEAEAMAHAPQNIHIKNNSWGPPDTGTLLRGPGPLTEAALATAVNTGRGGKGTILMWAGGNGRGRKDNSNYDGYANSIYTVAVGAFDSLARQSSYSEPGANLVICSPSDGATDALGKTTTDRTGIDGYNNGSSAGNVADADYTNDFGGTSSATPTASGAVALMLQANPNLGWRDVQEILMRSARKVSPLDADWVTNAGGINHNHKFGAGLLDAAAAVALSRTWTNLGAQQTRSIAAAGGALAIPDNSAGGASRLFDFAGSFIRVEHVTVTVNVSNIPKGQLEVTLTSPSGTVSRLSEVHDDATNTYSNWKFMTVRNWGESSNGVWTLSVADRVSGTTGSLVSATVTVHGMADARPTIVVTPANLTFSTDLGAASASKELSVSGQNLEGPVSLSVTGSYEVSTNNANFGSTLQLSPSGATLSGTPVYARIKASAPAGTARGSISLTSPNAVSRSVPLNGVVFGPAGEADTFIRTIIERFLLLQPEDPPNWRGEYGYGNMLDALLPFYRGRLAAGVHPNQAKSETMLRLTGFNTSSRLFDPNAPFYEVRAAFAAYAALGLAPDTVAINSFVRSMRTGRRAALPILSHVPAPNKNVSFNGFRDAPWSATYGMADAMQSVFASRAFRTRYPSVANLSSQNFYNWMQDTMFPGRGMGQEGSPTLISMLDQMSFDSAVGRPFAQAAAAAFRIVYASMLPTISSSGSNGSQVEMPFQRRLSRAALDHLLWGQWSYAATSAELDPAGMPALMRVPVIGVASLPPLQSGGSFGGYQIPASPEVTFFRGSGLPSWLQLDESNGLIRLRSGQSVVPPHSESTTYVFSVTAGHLLAETSAQVSLRVDPAAVSSTAFGRWLAGYSLGNEKDADVADGDSDGVCLLTEYAFGGDPVAPSSTPVRVGSGEQNGWLYWDGLVSKTYRVQSSTDLSEVWKERPDIVASPNGAVFSRGGVEYRPLRADVSRRSSGTEFYRVVTDFAHGELK